LRLCSRFRHVVDMGEEATLESCSPTMSGNLSNSMRDNYGTHGVQNASCSHFVEQYIRLSEQAAVLYPRCVVLQEPALWRRKACFVWLDEYVWSYLSLLVHPDNRIRWWMREGQTLEGRVAKLFDLACGWCLYNPLVLRINRNIH
jgi:hypothetical protein